MKTLEKVLALVCPPRQVYVWALVALASPVWAASVDSRCLPHFYQVDNHVFRGAQPTAEGWKDLAKMGVQVVVDLRQDGEARGEHWIKSERAAVEAAGMRYISLPMDGWARPDNRTVALALAELHSADKVFVHCRAGKDRTGTVIACYRMTADHWNNERALDEANSDGMNPLETAMRQYILNFHPRWQGQKVASAAPEQR